MILAHIEAIHLLIVKTSLPVRKNIHAHPWRHSWLKFTAMLLTEPNVILELLVCAKEGTKAYREFTVATYPKP